MGVSFQWQRPVSEQSDELFGVAGAVDVCRTPGAASPAPVPYTNTAAAPGASAGSSVEAPTSKLFEGLYEPGGGESAAQPQASASTDSQGTTSARLQPQEDHTAELQKLRLQVKSLEGRRKSRRSQIAALRMMIQTCPPLSRPPLINNLITVEIDLRQVETQLKAVIEQIAELQR